MQHFRCGFFFENDKFMFSHFRWWSLCNKMNSYTVDAFILFSPTTKTVVILVSFYCPGHELCHLKILNLTPRRESHLICFVFTKLVLMGFFYNNNQSRHPYHQSDVHHVRINSLETKASPSIWNQRLLVRTQQNFISYIFFLTNQCLNA